jgi:hypothetical protein
MSKKGGNNEGDSSLDKLLPDSSPNLTPDTATHIIINETRSENELNKKLKRFQVSKVVREPERIDLRETSSSDNSSLEEEGDLFNMELLNKLKTELNNTELKYRENEGQDTITSLTNNIYKRELLKRKASLKKPINYQSANNNSVHSSRQNSIAAASGSIRSASSIWPSIENTPLLTIKTLFKHNERTTRLSSLTSGHFLFNTPTSLNHVDIEQQNQEKTNVIPSGSRTDQVFDLIQDALLYDLNNNNNNNSNNYNSNNNSTLISSVKLVGPVNSEDLLDEKRKMIEICLNAVKNEQLKLKKKKDKARKACLIAEWFVFVFILILGILFVFSVLNVLGHIHYYTTVRKQNELGKTDKLNQFLSQNLTLNSTDYILI